MKIHLEKLKQILTDQLSQYGALKTVLEKEVEGDGTLKSEEVVELQVQKKQLVKKTHKLEDTRLEVVAEIAAQWGEEGADLTLKEIIARLPEDHKEQGAELAALQEKLMTEVEVIRGLGKKTAFHASARLRAIEATLAVVNEASHTHSTYSEEGHLQKTVPSFKRTLA